MLHGLEHGLHRRAQPRSDPLPPSSRPDRYRPSRKMARSGERRKQPALRRVRPYEGLAQSRTNTRMLQHKVRYRVLCSVVPALVKYSRDIRRYWEGAFAARWSFMSHFNFAVGDWRAIALRPIPSKTCRFWRETRGKHATDAPYDPQRHSQPPLGTSPGGPNVLW